MGESKTFPGEPALLGSRGVRIVALADKRRMALMEEFQQRCPEVRAEDIGED